MRPCARLLQGSNGVGATATAASDASKTIERSISGKNAAQIRAVVAKLARIKVRPNVDSETKTIDTAAGRLPVSPLMDPAYIEARRRPHLPKPRPNVSKHGRLERRLARNPYAQALATPIRLDPVNRFYLPRFFLQEFRFVTNPTTGQPWFVPSDDVLLPLRPEQHANGKLQADGIGGDNNANADSSNNSAAAVGTHGPNAEGGKPGRTKKTAPPRLPSGKSAYTLSRRDLLQQLSSPKGRYKGQWGKLSGLAGVSRAVCRHDMHALTLELMRRRAVEALLHFVGLCEVGPVDSGKGQVSGVEGGDKVSVVDKEEKGGEDGGGGSEPRKYLIPCHKWDELRALSHRGCVLWFGGESAPSLDSTDEGRAVVTPGTAASSKPAAAIAITSSLDDGEIGEFTTLDFEGLNHDKALPVHDMRKLLGQEHFDRLLVESKFLRSAPMFMLGRVRTIDLQLRLWKLQGYLAEYKSVR